MHARADSGRAGRGIAGQPAVAACRAVCLAPRSSPAFLAGSIGDRGAQLVTCGALLLSAVLGILLFRDILATERSARHSAGELDRRRRRRCRLVAPARHPERRHDRRRDRRLVDGSRLFDRLHGTRIRRSRASWPI